MRPTTRFALAATLTIGACFNPQLQEGAMCAEGDLCPPGQTCIDGRCLSDGSDAGVDPSAALSALGVSVGELDPPFDPQTTQYTLDLGLGAAELTLTPTAADPSATITIAETVVPSGTDSAPQSLAFGPNTITITVDAGGGVTGTYSIAADRGAAFDQKAYVKAESTASGDIFGRAIDVDGNTIVVGASRDDGIESNSGAVYVFVRSGDTWQQQARLEASNADQSDEFGRSVAISGDTIAIGAPFEDSSMPNSQNDEGATSAGATYIFVRTGTTWSQQAYLKAPTPIAQDSFGLAVDLAGDTLVASSRQGGHVFVRNGVMWSQQALLTNPNLAGVELAGVSVAISADTVAMATPLETSTATGVNGDETDDSGTGRGAVFVFVRSGTVWSQQAYIKASVGDDSDFFGSAVALSMDTLVVGAEGEDSGATGVGASQTDNSTSQAGAVYVFERNGTSWQQVAFIKASTTDELDRFGGGDGNFDFRSVAIDGDILAVGARNEDSTATGIDGNQSDNGGQNVGAVFVFTRTDGSWSQLRYVKPSNSGGFFGESLAISGGLITVGATGEDSAATGIDGNQGDTSAVEAGAAYFFE